MDNWGIILAAGLVMVHCFAVRLPIFSIIPRFRWTSFGGGVSLSFVFLEIFPELSHYQHKMQYAESLPAQHIGNHAYFIALLGLLTFYGLGAYTQRAKSLSPTAESSGEGGAAAGFWVQISGFAVKNVVFGYLLSDVGKHSGLACVLFFITVALHFFVLDEHLREHRQDLYDNFGRWILAGAIVLGTAIGQTVQLSDVAIAAVWSFLAGSIILNVLKRELPAERETCFVSFVVGCSVFAVLLFSKIQLSLL
ncbi:MAG: hypothetical protein F6K39_30805 [Okeania sp. SIO3B3]|nr:hypothetical protein [Okeania sp. SIO3B3]